jgi:hypothetical protein
MGRRIAFIDASGQTTVCQCVVLAGVVYEGPGSYLYAFSKYVQELKAQYNIIRGELKLSSSGGAAPIKLRKLRPCSAWRGPLYIIGARRTS